MLPPHHWQAERRGRAGERGYGNARFGSVRLASARPDTGRRGEEPERNQKSSRRRVTTEYIIKIKIHASCEIEGFVETHLCKLCVILRSRVLRVVCPYRGRRLPLQLQQCSSCQGQQGDVDQSVRGNHKTRF